jgi:hypothetical protein
VAAVEDGDGVATGAGLVDDGAADECGSSEHEQLHGLDDAFCRTPGGRCDR